jgi:DNA repair ATPase RecN
MATVQITLTEGEVEGIIEERKEKADNMNNVLDSFCSNRLTDTEAYSKLKQEYHEQVQRIEVLEEQLEEQTEDEESVDSIAELFG